MAASQVTLLANPEEETSEPVKPVVKPAKRSKKPQVVKVVVHETRTVEAPAKIEERPVAEVKAEEKNKVTLEDARDALENVNEIKGSVEGIFGM